MSLIRRWLDALRDPTNKQCFGALRDCNGAHCAVGLLAELCPYARLVIAGDPEFESGPVFPTICRDAGLSESFLGEVVRWNDKERVSFAGIADRIESRCAGAGLHV